MASGFAYSVKKIETSQRVNMLAYVNEVLDSLRDIPGQLQLTPNIKIHSRTYDAADVPESSPDVNLRYLAHYQAGTWMGSIRHSSISQRHRAANKGSLRTGWRVALSKTHPTAKARESGATLARQRAFAAHLFGCFSQRLRQPSYAKVFTATLHHYLSDSQAASDLALHDATIEHRTHRTRR